MDDLRQLLRAARQVLETELMFGGDFLPASRNPLPEPVPGAVQPVTLAQPPVPARGPTRSTGRQTTPTRGTAPVAQPAPAIAGDVPADMTPEQKAAALEELKAQAATCLNCTLGTQRKNLVFGEGSSAAQLVFVGEAPGEDEDLSGRPFVGKAGQLLTKMILAMGLRREDVYICNILKCRPPGNRPPQPDEVQVCWPFLMRQLQIIRPKVIVTLGNPATQNLLRTREGITRIRGQWQKLPNLAPGLEGTPVMPTFHPSFVLRTYTVEVRGKVWDDLKKVLEALGLPVPGRQ